MAYTGSTHGRMPYHSPYGRDRRVYSAYGWAGIPLWSAWGYPYLPEYWDSPDNDDSQPDSSYAASQPYPDDSADPYYAQPPDQNGPQPRPSYTPWPYGSPAAPSSAQPSAASVAELPVTLVFKDGRPPEQIHNYMLTATTLSILDQHYRAIPVDQIDLEATAKLNREAGVEFSLPGGTR
jgi:hypothetical protein